MIIESVLLASLSVPRIINEVSSKLESSTNISISNHINDEEIKIIVPTPKPEKTPKPTATPRPSKTPRPTRTPRPTATPKATVKPTTTPTSSTINTQNVLNALNVWRQKNGIAPLELDSKLQNFAQSRADSLKALGKLDNHAGFNDYIKNQNGFAVLGFNSLAENQSWNYKGSATGLIEQLYRNSSGHNKNQLNATYTHVGIGISGVYTNLVFGGKKR